MLALLAFLRSPTFPIVLAVVGSATLYHYGKVVGRQEVTAAALQRSVDVLRERGKLNAEISGSDANAMCGLIGLHDDERAECVRLLGESQP